MSVKQGGGGPEGARPVRRWQAAAAKAAATSPEVASLPRRKPASPSRSRTRPADTWASRPPECAWPPDGSRPSASSSRVARLMSEEEVALGHRELGDRVGVDDLAVDAYLEGVGVDLDPGQGVVEGHVGL